jgi:hypothetical protein
MSGTNYQASVQLILKAATTGTPHHEYVLSLGSTPQYLIDHGFPDKELKITAATIDKAHFEHGITRNILERLGDVIASPKALYKSATVHSSAVVVTLEQKNGSPILVPVHADKQIGRDRFNVIASVYNKEASIETRWTAAGLLLWTK